MSFYQVGMSIAGAHAISEYIASAVSRAAGGNGKTELIDGDMRFDFKWWMWMIDLPEPFDGEVKVVDECGITRVVVVETPMP